MNTELYSYKELIYLYLILINIITFIVFIWDKNKSKKKKWRIPESRLLLLSLIGGSMGGLLGMFIARHKTNHIKFTVGMPLILLINLITIFYLLK